MGRKWAYGANRTNGANGVRHYETLYIIRGRAWDRECERGERTEMVASSLHQVPIKVVWECARVYYT